MTDSLQTMELDVDLLYALLNNGLIFSFMSIFSILVHLQKVMGSIPTFYLENKKQLKVESAGCS